MTRKLILHVGTHKTGSTSIQRTVSLLARKRASGVTDLSNPMRAFIPTLGTAGEIPFLDAKASIQDALATHTRDGRVNIWSNEVLLGNPYQAYPHSSRTMERLAQVTEGYDVHCVIYFRRQDSFIESLYKQSLQEGNAHTTEEFIALLPLDRFGWNHLADSLVSAFGETRVSIFPYSASGHQGVVERFLAAAGLPAEAKPEPVENIGLTAPQAEIARVVNATMREPERKRLRWLFQRCNQLAEVSPASLLPRQIRERFAREFGESNRALAARFWPQEVDHWGFQDEHELPPDRPVTDKDLMMAMAQLIAVMPAETEYWTSGEPATIRLIRKMETGLKKLLRGA